MGIRIKRAICLLLAIFIASPSLSIADMSHCHAMQADTQKNVSNNSQMKHHIHHANSSPDTLLNNEKNIQHSSNQNLDDSAVIDDSTMDSTMSCAACCVPPPYQQLSDNKLIHSTPSLIRKLFVSFHISILKRPPKSRFL